VHRSIRDKLDVAGRTTSKVQGQTMPNEQAGVPSFDGKQPASEPLFAALSKAQVLVIAVEPSRGATELGCLHLRRVSEGK
jgi:hypothetical protein